MKESTSDILNLKLIKRIASLAQNYQRMVLNSAPAFLEEKNLDKIKDDWWLSLIYFFDRVFYQGRNDSVSGQFEKATILALRNYFDHPESTSLIDLQRKGLLEWDNYGYQKGKTPVNGLYSELLYGFLNGQYSFTHENKYVKTGTGKQRDREMVIDTLKFVSGLPDQNILK